MGAFPPPPFDVSPLGRRIGFALWSGHRGHSAARSFAEKSRCKKKKVYFVRWLCGLVGDHFFALRQRQHRRLGLVLTARRPASRPWRRLRLLRRVFLIGNIFLNDLRGIRRDPKTARRTRTSPSVGRLALLDRSAGSACVSG